MEQQEVLSTDQLRLQVDAFARFRMTEPAMMYRTIRTEDRLRDQLRTILGSSLRNELGKRTFAALLSAERGEVMDNIQNCAEPRSHENMAPKIIDVRIKRADLPAADRCNRPITGCAARESRKRLRSMPRARRKRRSFVPRPKPKPRGSTPSAIGKDPDFYDFYRAMQSYRQTFQNGEGQTNMIIVARQRLSATNSVTVVSRRTNDICRYGRASIQSALSLSNAT